MGQNADGRLEIFYVGRDGVLYHNWQISPNGAWAGEFGFPNVTAQQVAVARNADGRLEIFYVGTNNGLYHNWQNSPGGGWIDAAGGAVSAPGSELGSNSNYLLDSSCNPLTDVAVSIFITQDVVLQSNTAPQAGSSSLSGYTFQLRIELQNDSNGNIIGATFSAADNQGGDLGNSGTVLSSISGITSTDLSPIIALELNLVGPGNSEGATLSSGAGLVTYTASSILEVLSATPSCAEVGFITAETANSFYGAMTAGPSNYFSQSFSTSQAAPTILKTGRLRPRLTLPSSAPHKAR